MIVLTRSRSRSLVGGRRHSGVLAAVVALTVLVGVLTPVPSASAAPTDPVAPSSTVDVRSPGDAGMLLVQPYSTKRYLVVQVAPGIGVTSTVSPEADSLAPTGAVLEVDRFQKFVDRVSGVLDRIRATPTGEAALKAIPFLLAPGAKNVWTVSGPPGAAVRTSPVQIVFAESTSTRAAGRDVPFGVDPDGAGSLITLDGAFWPAAAAEGIAWRDPSTGAARLLDPVMTAQHELMHAIAALGGAAPSQTSVPVPVRAWSSAAALSGPTDTEVSRDVMLAEVFTHGGPRGLTAARRALTTPGPDNTPAVFSSEEFPSIAVDPWFLRSRRFALDRYSAADTPAADRHGWLMAAAARLSIAVRPPTELVFANERGVRPRPEYVPSLLLTENRGAAWFPVRVPQDFSDWEASDVRGRTDVVPRDGTWDDPGSAPLEAVGSSVPEATKQLSCHDCATAPVTRLSSEDAAAFEARVASEVKAGPDAVRAVQRAQLVDPVGDAVRQVHGPGFAGGVWSRYPELVAGLEKAPLRFFSGMHGPAAAGVGLDVWGLMQGDVSALSVVNTTSDLVTSVAPMLGARIANFAGAAGAVVGFVTSMIAFSQGGSETDFIASMVGLLVGLMPELAPFMVLYMAASLWSHPSPVEEAMSAGQQMIVAFKDWAPDALERSSLALADSVRDGVSDRMDEARYRSDYLQTKVDLAELAEGHDPTTGGKDGTQWEKQQIRDATDEELERLASAGSTSLDESLDLLADEYNNGAVFTEFRKKWAEQMNDDGGVRIYGIKHHVDLDSLPTTNPEPVRVDAFTTPVGSIRSLMQSRYRHALDELDLWTPSRNAFATPMVTEQMVLDSVAPVQRDWAFTGPLTESTAPVKDVREFTGNGTPGSFLQLWNPDTKELVCGATKVNAIGLWTCHRSIGFQGPGLHVTYELRSSSTDTGGFTSTGKSLTVTTSGTPVPRPVIEWGPDLRVEGRTVHGTATPGALVHLETMPPDSIDTTRTGLPASPTATVDSEGYFTLTATEGTPGGNTRLVATCRDHTIAERLVIDTAPPLPTPVPETDEDSAIHITHLTATSIEGTVPPNQKIQIRLGETPVQLPIDTDSTGTFHFTPDTPLPTPQTITLRTWPTDTPWKQSTRTITWNGHDQ
ncbi:hypothetical protein [Rathayibacter sp. VKM Ac-2760]|uniref:hypothetical protein n=1 Tax=Rathayibacter sp. VKM Ac-2760 TaxID=2609253 RepID=UPI001315EF89|nr:hypothetical protein [Rathayibacter sp. VKM Ac-2760]QHC59513.1 hypothetical protein GSU72_13825 [Rathayibacter sp. VKM Ac-2760]